MVMYKDLVTGWTKFNKDIGCMLKQVDLDHGDLMITMASWKGFPYFDLFNSYFAQAIEKGLQDRLERNWVESIENNYDYICSNHIPEPDVSIGLDGTRLVEKYFYSAKFGSL